MYSGLTVSNKSTVRPEYSARAVCSSGMVNMLSALLLLSLACAAVGDPVADALARKAAEEKKLHPNEKARKEHSIPEHVQGTAEEDAHHPVRQKLLGQRVSRLPSPLLPHLSCGADPCTGLGALHLLHSEGLD